jgi:hypothetical protein
MANRRNVLIGLGGLVAAGGAALGTGAFTTVEAQRTVTIDTAGDADAFLGLEVRSDLEADTDNNGLIQLDLSNAANASGLNRQARTVLDKVLLVENNGTQSGVDIGFTVDVTDGDSTLVSGDNGAGEIFKFSENTDGNFDPDDADISVSETPLASGEATAYDLEIELRPDEISNSTASDFATGVNNGDNSASFDVTVTITATSGN